MTNATGEPGRCGPEDSRMTASERRASVALAGIFTLRILGLFMILPVFSLHAEVYEGYTPLLAGLAIGVYGLTQAIFQIPFGMLSDRIGRKQVITAGLIIFAAGSVVAALADSMWGVIAGRALQGLGAIGAAVIALTADLTREDQRTKAMAIIGVSIGFAFALAMMVGHALTSLVGISGLFWLTAVLAIAGIVVLHKHVPTPDQHALSPRRGADAGAVSGDPVQPGTVSARRGHLHPAPHPDRHLRCAAARAARFRRPARPTHTGWSTYRCSSPQPS